MDPMIELIIRQSQATTALWKVMFVIQDTIAIDSGIEPEEQVKHKLNLLHLSVKKFHSTSLAINMSKEDINNSLEIQTAKRVRDFYKSYNQ